MPMDNVKEELKKLPKNPGVYIMHGANDEILYVGKAINLKNRVSQYFQKNNKTLRIQKMVSKIKRFEYIMTDNEIEALILECNLIKKHRPPYNVMLKDDKTYPYIKVTCKEKFPRIFITRSYVEDGSKYYGPYTDVGAVKEMLTFVKDLFPIKACKKQFDEKTDGNKPCLNYHIKKCLAPCAGKISSEEYRKMIDKICDFLEEKTEDVIKTLTEEMKRLSENMKYEEAGKIRDKIFALKRVNERQKINSLTGDDMDVIGINKLSGIAAVELFMVRNGKLLGRERYTFENVSETDEEEIAESFIKQFYNLRWHIPKVVLLRYKLPDDEFITNWLSGKRGGKVEIRVPQKGEKNRLLEMAEKNAVESFKEKDVKDVFGLLAKLASIEKIEKIEAYDISNTGNDDIVGAMVTFVNGKPVNKLYRKFKIKTVNMQDDISCTYEVIKRRLKRRGSDDESFLKLPDLILTDGGAGQVGAIRRALIEEGCDIPVVGMVKDSKHKTKALLINGKNIALSKYPEIFKLIYEIQEEVHRFVISYHRTLRSKRTVISVLDKISGIGDIKKKELLKHFGSIDKIREASVTELLKVKGITPALAERIKKEI